MKKGEEWKRWWYEHHGKHIPAGGYHRMEGAIHDAWSAGWDAALLKITPLCCTGDCRQGRECPERK